MQSDDTTDADLRADAEFWNLPPEALAPSEHDGPGVWPSNLPAVTAFVAIAGQMRFVAAPMGGLIALGLDYGAARAGLRLAGLKVSPEVWSDVQVIEASAVTALNRESQ